jgi:plastocyanin
MATLRSKKTLLKLVVAVVALLVINTTLAAGLSVRGPRFQYVIRAKDASLTDFYFEPRRLVVPASADVRLKLHNASSAPHTLILLSPIDRRTSHSVAAGAVEQIDFKTPGAGTYRFVCSVHEGMTGTLIVE